MDTRIIVNKVLNKKIREEKIISQVDLAKKLGITNIAISKWLNGALPDIEKVPLLCEILGITPNELFGYDTPEERVLADEMYKKYLSSKHKESIDILLNDTNI